MLEKTWLGHARQVVVLAFVATFLQQQVWQTVNQIAEASRKTVSVQLLGLGVAVAHLALVSLLLIFRWMAVTAML
jgi:hypothetical protein